MKLSLDFHEENRKGQVFEELEGLVGSREFIEARGQWWPVQEKPWWTLTIFSES